MPGGAFNVICIPRLNVITGETEQGGVVQVSVYVDDDVRILVLVIVAPVSVEESIVKFDRAPGHPLVVR